MSSIDFNAFPINIKFDRNKSNSFKEEEEETEKKSVIQSSSRKNGQQRGY